MSRRNNIIANLVTELNSICTTVRNYMLLDEINDFPTITLVADIETRTHIGDGYKLATLPIHLRGYVHGENSIVLAENLGRQIETAIQPLPSTLKNNGVEDIHIESIRTDEGLFEPNGFVEMTLIIIYEV